ncbi:FxsA family protein [Bdellovibrio bacteriovorus]|uniref:FxsA family protein n=1 Tax=Bdellovibrio bacteriovorus TaxID=959 RepID=UPI0035A6331D
MIAIPFPFIVAEIIIFIFAVNHLGFLHTLGLYLLPCLLGLFIVATVGRMAIMTLQSTVMRGQLPASRILHSGAIFLSGLLFLVPSFFTRALGLILFLPGLRHLAIWRFKLYMAKQVAKGSANFAFGNGPFGFGRGNMGGGSGFRYYEFRNDGTGFRDMSSEAREEREVRSADVLDVTPLKITHETKKPSDEK